MEVFVVLAYDFDTPVRDTIKYVSTDRDLAEEAVKVWEGAYDIVRVVVKNCVTEECD